jgi:hypothetical protein
MRLTVSIISSLAVALACAAGYAYYTQSVSQRVELTASQEDPPAPVQKEKAKPQHGDFEHRFQPKPPPANGGRLN